MGGSQGKLQKHDLMKKFDLTVSEYEELKSIFNEHSNGKKGLSKRQFRNVYSSRFPGNVNDYADKLFDCFDSDGNGKVDFYEFVVGISLMDSKNVDDLIDIAFKLFDHDRSGFIDRQEVHDLLQAYNELYGSNLINMDLIASRLFEIMDLNDDNQISRDEFADAFKQMPELIEVIRPSQL